MAILPAVMPDDGSIYPKGTRAGLEKPKLEIRETSIDQLAVNGVELFVMHAEELGQQNLLVDWKVARALEDGGMLVGLGLYYGEMLIGYCVSVLTPDLLHAGEKQCQNVATFLLPEHRRSTAGKLMIDSMEIVAQSRGATTMLWSGPPKSAIPQLMVGRDDTELAELMFKRRL